MSTSAIQTSDAVASLRVGDAAPDVTLHDQHGQPFTLSALRGSPVILYFYPKDMTPGCTTQACELRDAHADLQAAGYHIVGVSPDTSRRHATFVQKYALPFTLLADTEQVAAKAYGVWREKKNYGKTYWGIVRSTFVIDARGILTHLLDNTPAKGHADRLRALLLEA